MGTLDPTIGPLLSSWDVEQGVLGTLQAWLPFMLYRLEDFQAGAVVPGTDGLTIREGALPRPPVPESFRGGDDFESFQEDWLPCMIAIAAPLGAPERAGDGNYGQTYEVQLAAIVRGTLEPDTRQLASYYGAACSAAILQHGSLGGISDRTVMSASPRVFFPYPDNRRVARSVATYHCWVSQIVNEQLGPASWTGGEPPPPTDPSQVLPPWTTIEVTVTTFDGVTVDS